MPTGQIIVSSGVGVNVGTHTITEDALTKHLQRVVATTQDGSVFGTTAVPIGVSIVGAITATLSGTPSISGQVGASIIGSVPVTFAASANQSVSGTVGSSVIGTVPVTQSGTVISSIVNTVPSSVLVGASIIGTVPVVITSTIGVVTTSVYAVLSSITAVSVMNANTNRKGATVYNAAGTAVYMRLGTGATTSVYTVALDPNDYYEVPYNWQGVVSGITASNAGIINITELT